MHLSNSGQICVLAIRETFSGSCYKVRFCVKTKAMKWWTMILKVSNQTAFASDNDTLTPDHGQQRCTESGRWPTVMHQMQSMH